MNDIKAGEYIRTKYGEIAKVIEYKDEIVIDKEIKFYGIYRNYICEDELDFIVKHSKNIIDMIEIEDAIKIKTGQDFETHIIIDKGDIIYLAEQMQAGLCILDKIYTKEMMEFISFKVEKE